MVATGVLADIAGLAPGIALGKGSYPPLDVLLSGGETVLGQAIVYPEGAPQVTAAIVTMLPGQETGWHHHDAPLLAWMLEGELTVDYGADGTRSYGAGDALLEAFRSPHSSMPVMRWCGCWRCSWGPKGWRTR